MRDPDHNDHVTNLHAPLTLDFDYTRSLGPMLSIFMTNLRDQKIVGVRLSDNTVVVPPVEFDPFTHQALTESDIVEMSGEGTVTSWTWVRRPIAGQPFSHPFGWALIQLDGADTSLLHAVEAASSKELSVGARVTVRWAPKRSGAITDIAGFSIIAGGTQ